MEHGSKRWIAAIMCAWLLPLSPLSSAREPPAAGCIDLHAISGSWYVGEHEVLVRATDSTGARLALDAACPPFARGVDLQILAPDGWACPDGHVSVRGSETTCPVIGMRVMSASELEMALHAHDAQASVTLDRVEVRGRHWRDIRGTTDYCVDARFLRGWRDDDAGLVVEVSPRRHAGHRYYRVETVGGCPDLASARSIRLVARSGGAAVCGYPGDKVLLFDASSSGFARMGIPQSAAFGRSCEISRVTPLPRE